MKKQLISATAAACVSLAGLSLPAAAELPITLNAGAGYWYFDRDDIRGFEPDDTSTPWASLEWAFNDQWAAEILYAYDDSGEFEDGGPDMEVTTWQLGMLYYGGTYISSDMRLRPFLSLSSGEIKIEGDDFDTVETLVNGGAGVRWMFGERLGLRLEGRAVHSVDESETDFLLLAGLNFYLGKTQPDPEPAPLDSDGDGVPDDRDRCPDTPLGTKVDADGCPLAVAQVASIKLNVTFGFDSTEVQEQYFSDLEELANFLKRFSDLQVDVEGHTDNVGPEDYNMGLSQRRAQAVVDVLVNQHGIDASRLSPVGFGETQPVASNDTEEGRAQNRRVMATLEVEFEE